MSAPFRGPRAHSVAWTLDDDWLNGKITCHAAEGADCRLICREDCESWNVANHEHPLFDAGKCLVVEWLNEAGVLESHIGSHAPVDGFITPEFHDGYLWSYSEETP